MRPGVHERKVGTNLDQRTWDRLLRQVQATGETKGTLLRLALESYLFRLETGIPLEGMRRPKRYNDARAGARSRGSAA